jgi:hypothetical protein
MYDKHTLSGVREASTGIAEQHPAPYMHDKQTLSGVREASTVLKGAIAVTPDPCYDLNANRCATRPVLFVLYAYLPSM